MSADGDFWCPSAGDMSYPLSIRLLRPPGRVRPHGVPQFVGSHPETCPRVLFRWHAEHLLCLQHQRR
jgi:hypothetical protein